MDSYKSSYPTITQNMNYVYCFRLYAQKPLLFYVLFFCTFRCPYVGTATPYKLCPWSLYVPSYNWLIRWYYVLVSFPYGFSLNNFTNKGQFILYFFFLHCFNTIRPYGMYPVTYSASNIINISYVYWFCWHVLIKRCTTVTCTKYLILIPNLYFFNYILIGSTVMDFVEYAGLVFIFYRSPSISRVCCCKSQTTINRPVYTNSFSIIYISVFGIVPRYSDDSINVNFIPIRVLHLFWRYLCVYKSNWSNFLNQTFTPLRYGCLTNLVYKNIP